MQKIFKFINAIFKFLNKPLNGAPVENAASSMIKTGITSSASLTLSGILEANKKRIQQEIKELASKNAFCLENLFEYAKKNGAEVFFIKNAEKILKPMGETPGFILPLHGIQAIYLNLILAHKFSFATPPIFIFEQKKLSPYEILYNFYKWYACNSKLPGFDKKSIASIKNLDALENSNAIENLTYQDIMALKQAIARDKEAMEFTLAFIRQTEGLKTAYEKLKNNGANM